MIFGKKLNLYSVIVAVGTVGTPIAPAASIGWAAYVYMLAISGNVYLAAAVAFGSAVGLESVAALSGHLAVKFYRAGDPRWRAAAGIMGLYAVAGLYHLGDSIGGIMFVVAVAFWLLVGLRDDAETAAASAETARDMDRELERAVKLAKVDADRIVRIERVKSKALAAQAGSVLASAGSVPAPAGSGAGCPDCGRAFASTQAVNAHKRFCKGAA